ncbi:MAG: helix-turn-helix domain-containing protein [Caulobacteraceae bacterium]
MNAILPIGDHLRQWRRRRRMSQLDLACAAEVSARHLRFLETGRAQPSREMVLNLAGRLEVPARDRNVLLVAAGYAPAFPERALSDPALQAPREAIDLILEGQKPYPAFALDRHWNVAASNGALPALYEGVAAALLAAPVNVLRLSLHPEGLAPRIANLAQWRGHLLARLRGQIDLTADPVLVDLMAELAAYPCGESSLGRAGGRGHAGAVVPLQIDTRAGRLAFLSTTMVFGTPVDITLSELAVESFFPGDADTARRVHALAAETP